VQISHVAKKKKKRAKKKKKMETDGPALETTAARTDDIVRTQPWVEKRTRQRGQRGDLIGGGKMRDEKAGKAKGGIKKKKGRPPTTNVPVKKDFWKEPQNQIGNGHRTVGHRKKEERKSHDLSVRPEKKWL